MTDVLFVAFNRLEFTRFSFQTLLQNTNWDLVSKLVVYDDGSEDGTRELLYEMIHDCPSTYEFRETRFGSPVEVMNDYVESSFAARFAKIDSDIVVPEGWLEALLKTMDAHPQYEILGMEGGRSGIPPADFDGVYTVEPARWIGGVGLFRTATLGQRPRIEANGRFGWTEMQRAYRLPTAWITPDLAVSELSRVPFEPWVSLSSEYLEHEGWERVWPKMHRRWSHFYWAHWAPDEYEEIEE